MALIVIIGIKRKPGKPDEAVNLYTGYDADEGFRISEEAADEAVYSMIGRCVSPHLSPLRIEPHHPQFVKDQKAHTDRAKSAADAEKKKLEEKARRRKEFEKEQKRIQEANRDAARKLNQKVASDHQARADRFVKGNNAAAKTTEKIVTLLGAAEEGENTDPVERVPTEPLALGESQEQEETNSTTGEGPVEGAAEAGEGEAAEKPKAKKPAGKSKAK